jgi:hypothetical protein
LEDNFRSEKDAYRNLHHFNVQASGAVIDCYGWAEVTPESFEPCPAPSCSGNENDDDEIVRMRASGKDEHLPLLLEFTDQAATYSWEDPNDKQMRDLGVDFRPPTSMESWNWIMDLRYFGSDASDVPDGKDLKHRRHALLLEYLPGALSLDKTELTRDLAVQALSGMQLIQKALVQHGDSGRQLKRNLLVTLDKKAVWIDFDRARVYDRIDEDQKALFRSKLLDVYSILFQYTVRTPWFLYTLGNS